MTIAQADATGALKALSGIQISVYQRDTTTPVQIFRARAGATQGPATEAGASGGPNPFITGATGQVEFWAEGPAELDIAIQDTQAPARITTRTMGWNALPAAFGSFPTAMLAGDASLGLGSLGTDVIRQTIQIGQVIDWWRPNVNVPLPSGFEICDGHVVPAGQHEFAGILTSPVTLPDLRNVFILGADVTKGQAAGANQGNAGTDAPGIAGTGGSNAAKNFAHGHGVPGVDHAHLLPDHAHGVGSLYAGSHTHTGGSLYVTGHTRVFGPSYGGGEAGAFANSISGIGGGNVDYSGNLGIGGATAGSGNYWSYGAQNGAAALNTATNSTTWTADPGSDVRPRFYGLLKLMKVRRS